jgi:ABC-type multidrug transport system fused ATPase/permease subunit
MFDWFGMIVRFYEPALAKKWIFIRWLTQSVLFAFFDVFTILIFKWMAQYAEVQNMLMLSRFAWLFLVVSIVYTIWKYFIRHRWWAEWYYQFRQYVLHMYMSKFFQLDYTTIEKYGTGRLVYIISKGADERVDAIIKTMYSFVDVIIKLAFFVLSMALINIWYGVFFLLLYVVMLTIVYFVNEGALHWREERRASEEIVSKQIVRMIMSKQEVLQSQKIDDEIDRLMWQNDQTHIANIRTNDYIRSMFNVPLVMIYVTIVVVLFLAVDTMRQGTFVFADFVVMTTMIGYLTSSVMWSTEVFKDITKNFTFVQKIWNFFDTAKPMHGYDTWKKFVYKTGDIVISDVSFAYDGEIKVLDNISCRLVGGKKTALVGVSGGGKSTIVKMIAGYLQPDSGSVMVDGQDLSQVALKTYYPHVGYLTQDPGVFDGTVYDNLIYALDKKPTEKRLRQAIADAGCDFIDILPNGLDTEIGERGVRLSWWQRQRLAIARIFLKDPEIVLLDEPTSALDSVSEEKISQALHKLFARRTVVIIAHRLQTVKEADHIIVVGDGKVIEEWSHSVLVKKKGAYAKMLELQTSF